VRLGPENRPGVAEGPLGTQEGARPRWPGQGQLPRARARVRRAPLARGCGSGPACRASARRFRTQSPLIPMPAAVHVRTCMHTCTRPHRDTHACTCTHTHTCTYTSKNTHGLCIIIITRIRPPPSTPTPPPGLARRTCSRGRRRSRRPRASSSAPCWRRTSTRFWRGPRSWRRERGRGECHGPGAGAGGPPGLVALRS
jgi:hypothetical protein